MAARWGSGRGAALAALALALAGCTQEPARPAALPPPAPVPGAVVPPAPASTPGGSTGQGARDEDLIAAAVGYYEAVERAYRTLDTSEVEQLVTKDCVGCQKQLEGLRWVKKHGYKVEGGQNTYLDQRVLTGGDGERRAVRLVIRGTELLTMDATGGVVLRVPAAREAQQINLVRSGQHWRVDKILTLAS